ncbi:MAG: uncharacterized protein QOI61_1415 [Actinomycetota bacterium]
MQLPRSHIEFIERAECVRLLATQEVGRVAFATAGGGADIFPVNYVLDGDAIVFATAAGSKLSSADRGTISFEVDSTDAATRSGWSVVIHGFSQEITNCDSPQVVERLRSLPLNPWAGGDRPHLVRISPRTITGRRIGHPPAIECGTTSFS